MTPVLELLSFSDPDGDAHKQTRWWIATDSGFSNLVWEKYDNTGDMLSQQVDAGVLQPSTTYYWRAVFQDNTNLWGYWSNTWSFRTGSGPRPPTLPQLKLPVNGSGGVGLVPALELMGFSDPDGDTQQNTQWQVATDNGFTNVTVDWLDSDADKLRETLPGLPRGGQPITGVRKCRTARACGAIGPLVEPNTGDEAGHFPNGPTLKSPLAG